MTYFEWVDNLQKIKISPMDYKILNNLNGKILNGSQYVYNRFMTHIVNVVVYRLDNSYKNVINVIASGISLDDLSLELVKYKKELKFIDRILDLSVIKSEDKITMKTHIDSKIADINDVLRYNIEIIDIDGHYISAFKKIIESGEEK